MISRAHTVAFEGTEAREIEVQCALSPGVPGFRLVGLPDKTVAESRERITAAFHALGLALPAKKILVNLAPAAMPKEGAHFDLPVAIALLVALEVLPAEEAEGWVALGEMSLDGGLNPVAGVLPAALCAAAAGRDLVCPEPCGPEAALVDGLGVLAPAGLLDLVAHASGRAELPVPRPAPPRLRAPGLDMAAIRGQEHARRGLEVAAAGGHSLLLCGPPGTGKSMLARALPGILPPLTPREALEVAMIASVSGGLGPVGVAQDRPFRDPLPGISRPGMLGGGRSARPGELSRAHNGVLFLDELPEFPAHVLEALRQPLETGTVSVSRAEAHVTYPARFQLIAAMNPCRCARSGLPGQGCGREPRCVQEYQAKLSGPLLDRIDMRIGLAPLPAADLHGAAPSEETATVAARVAEARARQAHRYGPDGPDCNARASGPELEAGLQLEEPAVALLRQATERLGLSARGHSRLLRLARTIADLDGAGQISRRHLAEALLYRADQDWSGPVRPAGGTGDAPLAAASRRGTRKTSRKP